MATDIGEVLRDFCRREGMGFLALEFALPAAELIFGKGDAHWTPNTHRMAAQRIIEQASWRSARDDPTERGHQPRLSP